MVLSACLLFQQFLQMLDVGCGSAWLISGFGDNFAVGFQQEDGGKAAGSIFLHQGFILFLFGRGLLLLTREVRHKQYKVVLGKVLEFLLVKTFVQSDAPNAPIDPVKSARWGAWSAFVCIFQNPSASLLRLQPHADNMPWR